MSRRNLAFVLIWQLTIKPEMSISEFWNQGQEFLENLVYTPVSPSFEILFFPNTKIDEHFQYADETGIVYALRHERNAQD